MEIKNSKLYSLCKPCVVDYYCSVRNRKHCVIFCGSGKFLWVVIFGFLDLLRHSLVSRKILCFLGFLIIGYLSEDSVRRRMGASAPYTR
jgi:hypothetical protein